MKEEETHSSVDKKIEWIEKRMLYLEAIHESLKKELRVKDIILLIILGILIGILLLK